jgi:LysR family transcriptional regulator, transcriptional activator of the cysJI operon
MTDFRLASFLAVSRLNSFTRASEELHITQPAVSQHIRALEEVYGVKLLARNGRKIQLTPPGRLLADYGERIEAMYRGIERDMTNAASFERHFDVGVTLTLAEYVMPDLVGRFRRISPGTRIRLSVQNTAQTIDLLRRNSIVIAVVEGPAAAADLPSMHLDADELVAIAAPRHPLVAGRVKRRVRLGELLAADLILREPGSGTRAVFENYLVSNAVDPRSIEPFMEIGSINAIKSLVQSELGVTVISRRAVAQELADGTLAQIRLAGAPILREFRFVWTPDSDAAFIEEFTQFCRESIAGQA